MKTVKRSLVAVMAIALALPMMQSCKRGDNDPGMSLKSRTGRLAGTWTLMSETTAVTRGDSITYNASFDGTTRTDESWDWFQDKKITTEDEFSMTITIDKEGTYSMNQVSTRTKSDGVDVPSEFQTTVTIDEDGQWAWVGKNTTAEIKNKEAIVMVSTHSEWDSKGVIDDNSHSSSTGWDSGSIMVIDRLAKDELVIIMNTSETDHDGDKDSWSTTYTFTK